MTYNSDGTPKITAKEMGICEHCGEPIYENEDYVYLYLAEVDLHEDCVHEYVDEKMVEHRTMPDWQTAKEDYLLDQAGL